MSDLELTLKLRNNRLKRARLELGMTCKAMAEAVGITPGLYGALEGLKMSPAGRRGWKPSALAIARYHGVSPEELWPEAVLRVQWPELKIIISGEELLLASGMTAPALPSAEDRIIEAEQEEQVRDALERSLAELPWERREIIEWLYGLNGKEQATTSEIAEELGVTRSRISAIHNEVLNKLWADYGLRKAQGMRPRQRSDWRGYDRVVCSDP